MSRYLWIAALLIVPTVAQAGFNVTPPNGWKTQPADDAKKIADEEMRAHPGVQTQAQLWESPGGGQLQVIHTTFQPFKQEMTTEQFVDAAADVHTRAFVNDGAKITSNVKARAVNGQIVAERMLRGKVTYIVVVERALKAASGELQMMSLVCWAPTESTCKRAAASAVLTPAAGAAKEAKAEPAASEPRLTMHRMQAGKRDASGWYPASSTHGKFSVLMPAAFNDFEATDQDNDTGAKHVIHAVGTQLPNGVKFLVTCLEKRKPDPLTNVPAAIAPGQPVRKLTVAGKPAIEFTVADKSMSARVVDLGSSVCLMTVEAQNKAELAIPPRASVQRMFESFKLD